MRQQLIRAEWRRALKSLRAAELLRHDGLSEDAISRAYYGVMHGAKAALLVQDAAARSHAAVRRLFGQVLVKPGELEKEWAEILAHEQDQRGTAEYVVEVDVSSEAADAAVRDARRLLDRMARYLTTKGLFTEAPPSTVHPKDALGAAFESAGAGISIVRGWSPGPRSVKGL